MKRKAAANYILSSSETEVDKDINELIDNQLYDEIFRGAFETLDEPGKKILKLYWEGVSPVEIAEQLGYTYGYVRKKKCNSQAELIEKIKRSPGYKQIKNSESILNNKVT
jgi:DNA-directed RNA polymerase specialized sigma24 family protein